MKDQKPRGQKTVNSVMICDVWLDKYRQDIVCCYMICLWMSCLLKSKGNGCIMSPSQSSDACVAAADDQGLAVSVLECISSSTEDFFTSGDCSTFPLLQTSPCSAVDQQVGVVLGHLPSGVENPGEVVVEGFLTVVDLSGFGEEGLVFCFSMCTGRFHSALF